MKVGRTREVRDPQGQWWYIRATKMSAPAGLRGNPYARNTKLLDDPMEDSAFAPLWALAFLVARLPLLLLASLFRPLAIRFTAPKEDRLRRSWIHANTLYGQPTETRYWLVTGTEIDRPFNEIAAALEQGSNAQPSGTEYKGSVTT